MVWILVLIRRFITNNSKKSIMKYQNSSSKNTLKLFLCVSCVLWTNRHSANNHPISLCFDIVKAWRDAPINPILLLEEPVGKILSTSHIIKYGSSNITKYSIKTLCLPPLSKYESMHRNVTLVHIIYSVLFLKMGL